MDTVQNPVGPKAPRALFHTIYLLHCNINHRGPRLLVPSWFQQRTAKWKILRGLWTRCIKIWRDICLTQHQPLLTHHLHSACEQSGEKGGSHNERARPGERTHHIQTTSPSDSDGIERVWHRPGNSISPSVLQQGVNMDLPTRLCRLHLSWYQLYEMTMQQVVTVSGIP